VAYQSARRDILNTFSENPKILLRTGCASFQFAIVITFLELVLRDLEGLITNIFPGFSNHRRVWEDRSDLCGVQLTRDKCLLSSGPILRRSVCKKETWSGGNEKYKRSLITLVLCMSSGDLKSSPCSGFAKNFLVQSVENFPTRSVLVFNSRAGYKRNSSSEELNILRKWNHQKTDRPCSSVTGIIRQSVISLMLS
jgi:hypothetical protein